MANMREVKLHHKMMIDIAMQMPLGIDCPIALRLSALGALIIGQSGHEAFGASGIQGFGHS